MTIHSRRGSSCRSGRGAQCGHAGGLCCGCFGCVAVCDQRGCSVVEVMAAVDVFQ